MDVLVFFRMIVLYILGAVAVTLTVIADAENAKGDSQEGCSTACKDLTLTRIPAGNFTQGSNKGSRHSAPPHQVHVESFMIARHEVTWSQFCTVYNWALNNKLISITKKEYYRDLKYKDADGKVHHIDPKVFRVLVNTVGNEEVLFKFPGFGKFPMILDDNGFKIRKGWERHPVFNVTWHGAVAFCSFLSLMEDKPVATSFDDWRCDFKSTGYRLPTESEWEKAARGGLEGKMYPWGNQIHGGMANYHESGDPAEEIAKRISLHAKTTPVGYYDGNQTPSGPDTANGYGLYDMVGNVAEWCYDNKKRPYDTGTGILQNPVANVPLGMERAGAVVRGGSYPSPTTHCTVFARSGSTTSASSAIGFRIARSVMEKSE